MRNDLIEGRVDETVELDFRHRAGSSHRHTDRGSDNPRLVQRGIDHSILPKRLLQSLGYAEHAARDANVLTEDDRFGVRFHRLAQGRVDGIGHRHRFGRAVWFNGRLDPPDLIGAKLGARLRVGFFGAMQLFDQAGEDPVVGVSNRIGSWRERPRFDVGDSNFD